MGILSDIQAISADSAQLAADQAELVMMQGKVAAAEAAIAHDTTASAAADAQLSTDLQTDGPAFIINDDGSASIYTFSSKPPGYIILNAKPAT